MPIQWPEGKKQTWADQGLSADGKSPVGGAILAAGLGSRLEPLTRHYRPKPLFPLGGKSTMLDTWVRKFVDAGITSLSMNLCVLKETIREHFGAGEKYGAQILFAEEHQPSGTLGGVCKQAFGSAARLLPHESPQEHSPFTGQTLIVPSGDIVTNLDADLLGEMHTIHTRRGAAVTMVLVPVPWNRVKDFGTAILATPESGQGPLSRSGQIVDFHEKNPHSPSNLNNASVYFIDMGFLRELERRRTEASLQVAEPCYDFGKHVFPALLGKLPYARFARDCSLWGVQYDGAWFDVGQKQDYLDVHQQILDGQLAVEMPYERLPWGWLGTDVQIDFSRVTIVPPVVIGHRCVIESGAVLGPYAVVGDGWTIESGARVSRSVLWERYCRRTADGRVLTAEEMLAVDAHRVRSGSDVDRCIVAGGTLTGRLESVTVEAHESGDTIVRPLLEQPTGPRL
ncbi:MAG: sugar phosphate nucleotidyltransferase [Planctomycetota bacterium]